MERLVGIRVLYGEERLEVRVFYQLETCLDWMVPAGSLNTIQSSQSKILQMLSDTMSDVLSHNIHSQEKIVLIQQKMQKYPDLIKSIYDDLLAIHKSTRRMRLKLKLPLHDYSGN